MSARLLVSVSAASRVVEFKYTYARGAGKDTEVRRVRVVLGPTQADLWRAWLAFREATL